jgi:hypothetical protein
MNLTVEYFQEEERKSNFHLWVIDYFTCAMDHNPLLEFSNDEISEAYDIVKRSVSTPTENGNFFIGAIAARLHGIRAEIKDIESRQFEEIRYDELQDSGILKKLTKSNGKRNVSYTQFPLNSSDPEIENKPLVRQMKLAIEGRNNKLFANLKKKIGLQLKTTILGSDGNPKIFLQPATQGQFLKLFGMMLDSTDLFPFEYSNKNHRTDLKRLIESGNQAWS